MTDYAMSGNLRSSLSPRDPAVVWLNCWKTLTSYCVPPGMAPCSIPRSCQWQSNPPLPPSLPRLLLSFLICTTWVCLFPRLTYRYQGIMEFFSTWVFSYFHILGHNQSDLHIVGWERQVRLDKLCIYDNTATCNLYCIIIGICNSSLQCWFQWMKTSWSLEKSNEFDTNMCHPLDHLFILWCCQWLIYFYLS